MKEKGAFICISILLLYSSSGLSQRKTVASDYSDETTNRTGSGLSQRKTVASDYSDETTNRTGSGLSQRKPVASDYSDETTNSTGSGLSQRKTVASDYSDETTNSTGSGLSQNKTGASNYSDETTNSTGSGLSQNKTGASGYLDETTNSTGSSLSQNKTGASDYSDETTNSTGMGVMQDIAEAAGEDKVCYKQLGCFSLKSPWTSLLRPLPAPWDPNRISPSVTLFTRNSGKAFRIPLDSDLSLRNSNFKASRPTVIMTHGFASNGESQWLHDMKDAYLKNVDANAFILDWGKGASITNYLQVASNTRIVGAQLARFVRSLLENRVNTTNIHLIGHSLGAHIMSYCAKNVSEISKINRITALDPAQPGFEGNPNEVRLASTDAENVDVIHTDAKPFIPFLGFGMMTPTGTVDFYMNGGSMQPGCLSVEAPNITSLTDLLKYPCEVVSKWVACSHGRSYEYYTASLNLNNCTFWGRKMTQTESFLKIGTLGRLTLADPLVKTLSGCSRETCSAIGIDTFKLPSRGSFAVTTDNEQPYCMTNEEETRQLKNLFTFGLYDQATKGLTRRLNFLASFVSK